MSKVIKGSRGPAAGPPVGRPPRPAQAQVRRPSNKGVISREQQGAYNEAQAILQKAHEEGNLIRSQAEEYRQKGYEDGHVMGQEQGKAEWTEAVLTLNRQNDERFRHFEPEVVKLAIRIAEKIIGQQVQMQPETIVNIVNKALGAVKHQREIYMRVNPQDYEYLIHHKARLLDALTRAPDIDIRADQNIPQGGCMVESEIGTIEATLEKQLASIEKILLGT